MLVRWAPETAAESFANPILAASVSQLMAEGPMAFDLVAGSKFNVQTNEFRKLSMEFVKNSKQVLFINRTNENKRKSCEIPLECMEF